MTQEQKDLLIKDLCGRLSYGVKCNVGDNKPYTLSRVEIDDKNGHLLDFIETKDELDIQVYLSEVKPYLFSLSNMTDEQKVIYGGLCYSVVRFLAWDTQAALNELVDWLNKNHFDYRGLIEKGLAIDATNLNIY